MGSGIAQVAAACGYDVVMRDMDQDIVAKGISTIERNLERLRAKDKISTLDKRNDVATRPSRNRFGRIIRC